MINNMNIFSLHNIRLNVEAGILFENFVGMVCPNENLKLLFDDQQRCYAERGEDNSLSICIVKNGEMRTCQIQSGEWEPIVESSCAVLMATSNYYKTRFVSHMIAVTNCIHKLALYEYEAFLGAVGPDYVGNPEDDARKCINLWAE
jgi:hypothetical protein